MNHDVFGRFDQVAQPYIDLDDLRDCCQISAAELDNLIAEKGIDYHFIQDGTRFGFVNPSAFLELVDAILVHLNADPARSAGEIKAADILANQMDEIDAKFRSEPAINFGLRNIADFDEATQSYKLNPFKIRKSVGKMALVTNPQYQLNEFRKVYRNALEISIPAHLLEELSKEEHGG